uniref:Uncharacterized protein n=1 Tax=Bougainvillea spectabilis TaxID=146096 RepID=A0A7T1WRP4_9CARY|nr:hypothetical protein KQ602_mgp24 [Bougainvillea spectabilis]QPP04900.1 hypothetical protein [Bougainvillea spectabilis]
MAFGLLFWFLRSKLLDSGFISWFGPIFSFFRFYCFVSEASSIEGSSRGSGWTDFDINVLAEPFSETEMEGTSGNPSIPRGPEGEHPAIFYNPNISFESSLMNRIHKLENEESPFLLGKEKGQYWTQVKADLDQAPNQREYNRLLDFENRDLTIREQKHECLLHFRKVVYENPHLLEEAPRPNPDPDSVILSFFDEIQEELERELGSILAAEPHEMKMVEAVTTDFKERGPDSYYVKKILGYFDKPR